VAHASQPARRLRAAAEVGAELRVSEQLLVSADMRWADLDETAVLLRTGRGTGRGGSRDGRAVARLALPLELRGRGPGSHLDRPRARPSHGVA